MKASSACYFLICLAARTCEPLASISSHEQDPTTLIWAMNGGGWRAMASAMGFANVFAKAGLVNQTSSRFNSISANSGGSWFTTQFFYSPMFFQVVLSENLQDLYDFVLRWMQTYSDLFHLVGNLVKQGLDSLAAEVLLKKKFELADLFKNMIEAASRDYGDPGFVDRIASPNNRVQAMRGTDLYIQSTLYPTARVEDGMGLWKDSVTFIGPTDSDHVYTTPLPIQYAIKENRTFFFFGVEDSSLPLRTCVTETPTWFSLNDWEHFPFYPGDIGQDSIYLPLHKVPACQQRGELEGLFGNETLTTFQAFLAGSVTWSQFSSRAPSSYAQMLSVDRYLRDSATNIFDKLFPDILYKVRGSELYRVVEKVVDLGLCSQWPNPCSIHDAQIGDGEFSDSASLGLHIGQHHSIDQGDKNKTLKVILTLFNEKINNYTWPVSYFNTTFNQGVEPGEFMWGPSLFVEGAGGPQTNPVRFPQIFEEYMDQQSFETLLDPVLDAKVSTVRMNATTVDNPAFHVHAGQRVDLLILVITDNEVPTILAGFAFVDHFKGILAETARSIGASVDLLQRVVDFVS